jgi:ubiquinone/menaquinone biosynthesis C-methylase UbiE
MEVQNISALPYLARIGFDAIRWYGNNNNEQYYNPRKIEIYDEAAQLLTQREAFGQFLVDSIGADPGNLLEIAAGTGLVSSVLSNNYNGIVFEDLSSIALKQLQRRVSNGSGYTVRASFYNQPYQTGSFDTIVCVGGYRYVQHDMQDTFWKETIRMLQPSGRLFFAQFKPRGIKMNGTTLHDTVPSKNGLKIVSIKNNFWKI